MKPISAKRIPGRSLPERLDGLSIPEPFSGCVLWIGNVSHGGYGQVNINKRQTYAHRAAYECRYGPIPEGLQLDHLCRTRCCINPAHLEPVTPKENSVRRTRLITQCAKGHEYSRENTRLRTRTDGRLFRSCLQCARANDEKQRRRLKRIK